MIQGSRALTDPRISEGRKGRVLGSATFSVPKWMPNAVADKPFKGQ
jgi:hypothetical protein